MASASAPSVPGRTASQRASAARTVSVRRWSTTSTWAPRARARRMPAMASGGEALAGLVPQTTTSSVRSRSAKVSIFHTPLSRAGAITPWAA